MEDEGGDDRSQYDDKRRENAKRVTTVQSEGRESERGDYGVAQRTQGFDVAFNVALQNNPGSPLLRLQLRKHVVV